MTERILTCTCCPPLSLSSDSIIQAANIAAAINPVNAPALIGSDGSSEGTSPSIEMLALLTTKYWGARASKLTVSFLDNPSAELRRRILFHMNAWSKTANVSFVETNTDPVIRISRDPSHPYGYYWSGLGTDVTYEPWFPASQPTMNLGGFTMNTSEAEFTRVVRHETGHTLGFPHEHLRREIIDRIDRAKAIAYYQRTNGWNEAKTVSNVLTPFEEGTIRATSFADPNSIMCYQLAAEIMKDGIAIPGGADIDNSDYQFAGMVYPKPVIEARGFRVTARNGLRMRTGPGLDYDVIQLLPLDTKVYSNNQQDGWSEIDLQGDGNTDGWASSSFLRPV